MKKLSLILTTTLIVLAVLMSAPTAMADKGKGPANLLATEVCKTDRAIAHFGTVGKCMSFFRADATDVCKTERALAHFGTVGKCKKYFNAN
ncbi:MAG: hypothetical protein DRR42_27290 [Gammaproteobacteria bacterium]|nr:MAG: hypothetical protein DRR42_27290 [Gammaproteobacteria bacterium]